GRLPTGATGAIVGDFAVAMVAGSPSEAKGIGECLQSYATALKAEFQIDSPEYMVTAYIVGPHADIYTFARQMHGLTLPRGGIAYSGPDDMSLISWANEANCGSAAHELVHLTIRKRFPGAPAWLEEGLASEVAVASTSPLGLRFHSSWRDIDLSENLYLRPK